MWSERLRKLNEEWQRAKSIACEHCGTWVPVPEDSSLLDQITCPNCSADAWPGYTVEEAERMMDDADVFWDAFWAAAEEAAKNYEAQA